MTSRPTQQQLVAALAEIISALKAETKPTMSDAVATAFSCFSPEALAEDPDIKPTDLIRILNMLTIGDLPTFERALAAVTNREQAWIGFKIVTDASVACDSTDTEVTGFSGEGKGSADALAGVFFASEGKEIVFSRTYSARDRKQMLDITRGPHMHNRQYAGLAWTSQSLEPRQRVIMFGAGDVSSQLEIVARLVGFETIVIDDDANYLSEERFPNSQRVLVPSFNEIGDLEVGFDDYLCVLTRGHMYDPEALTYAVSTPAGYIGMMGTPLKNERVYELAEQKGVDPELFKAERLFAPIGFKFIGDKSPAGLAVSIVAQLLQVRSDRRKKP